mgnify:CR=1 FL=1
MKDQAQTKMAIDLVIDRPVEYTVFHNRHPDAWAGWEHGQQTSTGPGGTTDGGRIGRVLEDIFDRHAGDDRPVRVGDLVKIQWETDVAIIRTVFAVEPSGWSMLDGEGTQAVLNAAGGERR